MTFQLIACFLHCEPLSVPSFVVGGSARLSQCAILLIFWGSFWPPDCLNTEPQKTKTSLHRPQKPDLSFVKILPAPRPLITR